MELSYLELQRFEDKQQRQPGRVTTPPAMALKDRAALAYTDPG
jgi:hypothetical protein